MKHLTCEMCGSTDLIKEDGVFVCQTCGCKYSVEEAKKMMIEGTVDVSGSTVKIDRSNEIANRIQSIKNEFKNGNNENVKGLCLELLNIEPDCYEAIIYGGLAEGWQSSIANNRLTITSNELQRAIEIIRRLEETDEKFTKLCIMPMQEMKKIAAAMFRTYANYNDEQNKQYNEYQAEARKAASEAWDYLGNSGVQKIIQERIESYKNMAIELENNRVNTYNNGCGVVCTSVLNVAITIINNIHNEEDVCPEFFEELESFYEVCNGYRTTEGAVSQSNSIKEYLSNARVEYRNKQNKLKEEKIAKYWEEHADEKTALESELETLTQEGNDYIKSINEIDEAYDALRAQKYEEVPSDKNIADCKERIEQLVKEKLSLGLFKGKEKKALQERIDEIETELSRYRGKRKEEKTELEHRIDAQIKEVYEKGVHFREKVAEIEKRIEEIKAELDRDR